MTAVIIYERVGTEYQIAARWEDGSWTFDNSGFSDIPDIDIYDAEMLLDRFNSQEYRAFKEINLGAVPNKISSIRTNNARREEFVNDFAEARRNLAEDYIKGRLNREEYTAGEWDDILRYVEIYG